MLTKTEKFIIEGGLPLEGEINVMGAKNSAGPLLAATLLTEEECIIDNIPLIQDVLSLIEIIKSIGVETEWLNERKLRIKSGSNIDVSKMDFEKASKIRLSVLLMGALFSRVKNFRITKPGGDKIGLRPISTHIESLRKIGANINESGSFYEIESGNLGSQEIILKEFSVTATENLIMASVFCDGEIVIKGAAAEPYVQDLGEMLNKMGAKITGLGTHTIVINGVKKLNGVSHRIIPDPNEAGTFILAGAITPGQVKINEAIPEHLDLFLDKLEEIGVEITKDKDFVIVNYSKELKSARVQALPYPGFPTDLLPCLVPLLTQAVGKSLVHDPLYENRLNYINELRKMGADIDLVDPHRAIVFGKTELSGQKIESSDIRAGASLVIAGLLAKGRTIVENVYQIDRGYEKIEERLVKIGANIQRTE